MSPHSSFSAQSILKKSIINHGEPTGLYHLAKVTSNYDGLLRGGLRRFVLVKLIGLQVILRSCDIDKAYLPPRNQS